jgi:hypothetical protein
MMDFRKLGRKIEPSVSSFLRGHQDSIPSSSSHASQPAGVGGLGFPQGSYFVIQARKTGRLLTTCGFSYDEGSQVQTWPRQEGGNFVSQTFFIDGTGALCHGSGLAVDIVDDVPVLRQRRPVITPPNAWSHPLPLFSLTPDSQIEVKFLSDPAFPTCTQGLYPNGSWRTDRFVFSTFTQKDFHMHTHSEFDPWRPRKTSPVEYITQANHNLDCRVLVEKSLQGEAIKGETLWDIVPVSKTN